MLDHVEMMFDDMKYMIHNLRKPSYQKNMETFRDKNGHFFQEMIQYMKQSIDKEAAAKEIADCITDAVKNSFSKKGKINSRIQVDLNLFMIYYVFPAILLTESEDAVLVAEHIRETWAAKFKNSNIQYADYDRIYESFQDRIFGIPINR